MSCDHFYVSCNPLTSILLCYLHIAWPHLADYITLHWLYYSTLTALHCTDFITLHFTSPQRVQVKVHITVPHVTEAPFSVGSVWSGQPTLGIDRRGPLLYQLRSPSSSLPVLLALINCPYSTLPTLLFLICSPYSTVPTLLCSLLSSPSLLFSLCFHLHILCVVSSSSLVLIILSYLDFLASRFSSATPPPIPWTISSLLPYPSHPLPQSPISPSTPHRALAFRHQSPPIRDGTQPARCAASSQIRTQVAHARTQYLHEMLVCVAL